ncbi:MAG: clan AA aspartic protease [Planctomycetota bacterium]
MDSDGRALIDLKVAAPPERAATEVAAWIDTGFNGELVLPKNTVSGLGLVHSANVNAVLADGSTISLETFSCVLDWLGESRKLEVSANDGDHALLGVGLLVGHDLRIGYRAGEITIN